MAKFPYEKQGYCPTCERNTLARQRKLNPMIHIGFSILTCGLYLPIFFIVAVVHDALDRHLCVQCGDIVKRPRSRAAELSDRRRRRDDRDD